MAMPSTHVPLWRSAPNAVGAIGRSSIAALRGALLFFVVCLLHCPAGLPAQEARASGTAVSDVAGPTVHTEVRYLLNLPNGANAMTTCTSTDTPVIFVKARYAADADTLDLLLVHEEVHVRQINKFPGGCAAAEARFRSDPVFRLDMEAEAYCVQAVRQVRRLHDDYSRLADAIVTSLWATYNTSLTFEQTRARIYGACKKANAAWDPNPR
jgi:hypothetical protein